MNLLRRTLDFIEGSRTAATAEGLLDEALRFCSDFDIDGMFVADVPDPGESIDAHILLKGWNSDWIDRYAKSGYVHLDPVARALKLRSLPFLWPEACDRRLERCEALVMGEAAEHGLLSGISVPIYDIEGRLSCVSFSGWKLKLDGEAKGAIQMVAGCTLARLREIRRGRNAGLTNRERECLAWASLGKTTSETSQIIGISTETAREYVSSASRKLGVCNKTHAVAAAIRIGIIS